MFLDALNNQNRSRPPVWLMRQAGRYMPSYQEYRKKYSLKELFFTPELAAKITLLPIDEIGVDAAILFSDITVIAPALGFSLNFSEGPKIEGGLKPKNTKVFLPIEKTIQLIKQNLKKPLIGFCGGPFTVLKYMPRDLNLLKPITDVTIDYLKMQEEAGVDVIQIFDSWCSELSKEEFQKYRDEHLQKLIDAVDIPVIFFMRRAGPFLDEIIRMNPACISVDWDVSLAEVRKKTKIPLQGNLNPDLLFKPVGEIEKKTVELIESMRDDPGFIVNLGHGVKPGVSVDAVKTLVKTVQSYEFDRSSNLKEIRSGGSSLYELSNSPPVL